MRGHVASHTSGGRDGQQADNPREIPFSGWKAIGGRALQQTKVDHISIVSAGVAFFAFLAFFPAIAAAFSIYGLMHSPAEVEQQMAAVSGYLPQQASDIVAAQLHTLATNSEEQLGWGVALSVLLGLWSANKGTKALLEGINIAYNGDRERGFFAKIAISMLFTLGGVLLALVAISLLVVFPAVAATLGLPWLLETAVQWLRWPLLAGLLLLAFALAYRYGPVREDPKFRWVSVGSVLGVGLWLLGSVALSLYVANFGNLDKTYGSIAAVVILLLWLYLSSFAVLLGAEFNSEMELQTAKDSTTGQPRPMGRRGAYHADHVAR